MTKWKKITNFSDGCLSEEDEYYWELRHRVLLNIDKDTDRYSTGNIGGFRPTDMLNVYPPLFSVWNDALSTRLGLKQSLQEIEVILFNGHKIAGWQERAKAHFEIFVVIDHNMNDVPDVYDGMTGSDYDNYLDNFVRAYSISPNDPLVKRDINGEIIGIDLRKAHKST